MEERVEKFRELSEEFWDQVEVGFEDEGGELWGEGGLENYEEKTWKQ